MATINASTGADIIVPSNNGTTYRGLEGNDTYIISNAIAANAKVTIVDTSGANTIQLVDGLSIASSKFAGDSAQLTLSNGAVVTINGADQFTYDVGGNSTSGVTGSSNTYAQLASAMGVASLPTGSTISDGTGGTISGSGVSSSVGYTLSADSTSVAEGDSITYTITASSAPTSAVNLTFNVQGDTNGGSVDAATNADIASLSGSVTMNAGETTATFTVTPNIDGDNEGLEGIKVSVFDANNSVIGSATALISNTTSTSATTTNLSTGTDSVDAGSGTNTVGAVVYGNNGTGTTFQPGDTIDGGEGSDTLKLSFAGALATTDYTASGTNVSNVERIEINNFGTNNALDSIVDMSLYTGYEAFGVASSSATGDTQFTNVATIGTVIARAGAGDILVDYTATAEAGTNSQSIEMSGYTGQLTIANVENVTIDNSTVKSNMNAVFAAIQTLTITGDKKLDITAASEAALPAGLVLLNAGAATGGITTTVQPTATFGINITGSSGNDSVNVGTTLDTKVIYDGGDGVDTLIIGDPADVTALKAAGISNVEILGAGATSATQINTSFVSGLTGVASYFTDADTIKDGTGADFAYLTPENSNIYIYADDDVFATLAVDTADDTGNVFIGSAIATADVGVLDATFNDFETINLNASGLAATQTQTLAEFGGTDLTTLNVTGTRVTITAWNGSTKLTTIDASGVGKFIMSAANPAGALYPDTITGSPGDDTLGGGAAASTIKGGAGADTITGNAGADTLHGEDGADIITGGAGTDNIDGGAGNDYIYTGTTLADFEDLAVAETIDGGSGIDVLFINGASATITAADIANVKNVELFYFSGAGDDTITFNDTYFTNAGVTSQTVRDFTTGGTFTLTASALSADNSIVFQTKHGTEQTETITGGAGDDTFEVTTNSATHLKAADTYNGGKGNDTLHIIAGSAALTSATQSGVDNIETIKFSGTAGVALNYVLDDGTFVTAATATASGNGTTAVIAGVVDASGMTGSGVLTFTGSAEDDSAMTITGGNGADILTGGSTTTAGDTINGGNGDDVIDGDAGIDTLNGGDGDDRFEVNTLTDFIGLTTAETVNGGDGTDTLRFDEAADTTVAAADLNAINSIEKIVFNGAGALSITLSDTVFEKNGSDSIIIQSSAAGAFTVAAGGLSSSYSLDVRPFTTDTPNTDTITGGAGNDAVKYYDMATLDTADTINGNGGTDSLILYAAGNAHSATYTNISKIESITYALYTSTAAVTATLADANFVSLDSAPISAATITSVVTVDASAENDSTVALTGGTGNDILTGTDTYLTLTGDTINGGNGADIIDGSLGGDTLTGGAGADVFVYNGQTDSSSSAPDSITDYLSGTDKLQIHLNYASVAQDLTITGDVSAGKTSKTAAQESLTGIRGQAVYNTETSQLYVNNNGDNLLTSLDYTIGINAGSVAATTVADADVIWKITGGTGADIITGNVGADIIDGGSGADVIASGGGIDAVTLDGGSDDSASDTIKLGSNELASTDTTAVAGSVAVDTVANFVQGANDDKIEISIAGIESLGGVEDLVLTTNVTVTTATTTAIEDGGAAIDTVGAASTFVHALTIHDGTTTHALTEAGVEIDLATGGGNALTLTNALTDGDAFLMLIDNGANAALFLIVATGTATGAMAASEFDVIKLLTLTGEGAISADIHADNFSIVA